MGTKKRQQTINKRNRERAVAEKRALKQQARQEKREAARNGELESPELEGPADEQVDEPGYEGPAAG
jgi:hypothetical protein